MIIMFQNDFFSGAKLSPLEAKIPTVSDKTLLDKKFSFKYTLKIPSFRTALHCNFFKI